MTWKVLKYGRHSSTLSCMTRVECPELSGNSEQLRLQWSIGVYTAQPYMLTDTQSYQTVLRSQINSLPGDFMLNSLHAMPPSLILLANFRNPLHKQMQMM